MTGLLAEEGGDRTYRNRTLHSSMRMQFTMQNIAVLPPALSSPPIGVPEINFG